MYKLVSRVPATLAKGKTLAPGDEVANGDVNPKDLSDATLIDEGRLVKLSEEEPTPPEQGKDNKKKEGEKS